MLGNVVFAGKIANTVEEENNGFDVSYPRNLTDTQKLVKTLFAQVGLTRCVAVMKRT